jgi:hypothetical protein
MNLISRAQFEHRLSAHLNEIEPGLALRVRRRIGYAWEAIIDHMYRQRIDGLTFANLKDMIGECAQAIVKLGETLRDE